MSGQTRAGLKTGKRWTLDDIHWDRFDGAKLDPEIVKIVKAASLVEYNGADYATYLCNVFSDDPDFQAVARNWAEEEVQHGQALGRWAHMADPSFDFARTFKRFTEGFRLPLDVTTSVRGSRAGELVARCIVEVGTSSNYSALGAATEEPVLKELCRYIAADEFRHYKLFYTHMKRYLKIERISKLRRLAVALGRLHESEDDELAYAYYAANGGADEPYERKRWSRAYTARALSYYRPAHVERGIAMTFKAAGLAPRGQLARWTSRGAYWLMRSRQRRAARP
jgi:rubrerythrin